MVILQLPSWSYVGVGFSLHTKDTDLITEQLIVVCAHYVTLQRSHKVESRSVLAPFPTLLLYAVYKVQEGRIAQFMVKYLLLLAVFRVFLTVKPYSILKAGII